MVEPVEHLIPELRGKRVMLDSDLARIYGVPTKRLNEQGRRNADRFPPDFAFQVTPQEVANLESQIATPSFGHGGRRKLPFAFTEHGALMAANVLSSRRAVEMRIHVIRAFVTLRRESGRYADLVRKLAELAGSFHRWRCCSSVTDRVWICSFLAPCRGENPGAT